MIKYLVVLIVLPIVTYADLLVYGQTSGRENRAYAHLEMRLEYSESDKYHPYFSELSDIQSNAEQFLEEGKFDKALEKVDKGLAIDELNIRLLVVQAAAFREIGEIDKADQARAKWMALIDSILTTGNGISFDSAFKVISVDEEYAVFRILDIRPVKQELVKHNGEMYDLIYVKNKDGEGETTIYFNVDIPQKGLYANRTGSTVKTELYPSISEKEVTSSAEFQPSAGSD